MIILNRFFCLTLLIFMAMGCSPNDKTTESVEHKDSDLSARKVKMTKDQFLEKVRGAGGGVDFIFPPEKFENQCHASTIVSLDDGSLIAAWFWGSKEGNSDVGIWMSRFHDNEWGEIYEAARVMDAPHWNPVLFRDPDRGIFLFFKVGPKIPTWRTFWMRSRDGGVNWTKPEELVPGDKGGRGPVKNKPIILSDGSWLAPASTEKDGWNAFADRSEDGGETWIRSENFDMSDEIFSGKGAIQPTFWESDPGHVHALLRTQSGVMARVDSEDYGRTWSKAYAAGLPNNNSGIDALGLEDGKVLLVYNPVSENWGPRHPLNLALSRDNGQTWEDLVSLESEEGEFSYPSIVRTPEGVAIVYTWKRKSIRCWRIPLPAIE